jgi:hypothetical protein
MSMRRRVIILMKLNQEATPGFEDYFNITFPKAGNFKANSATIIIDRYNFEIRETCGE